ncbi:MAG TPA: DUF6636 domain-containing protein [Baekduia sp.]|nr:DUF6636 domain-containing protein [Baekduia sp.]
MPAAGGGRVRTCPGPAASVLLVAALCLAAAASASAKDRVVFFSTPSRGIGCVFSDPAKGASFLRCDVLDPAHPPKRPASCELDWGTAFGLSPRGHGRRLCVGDTALSQDARVLGYGHHRRLGPFRCASRRTGLRCTNRAHHGFSLARERQRLF